MKCPVCGLEMLLYGKTVNKQSEPVQSEYVCRNKRCPRFDVRLKKKAADVPTKEDENV